MFIPDIFGKQLTFLLLNFLTHLLSTIRLFQATLLPLTDTFDILFLVLYCECNDVHLTKFLVPLRWITEEVLAVCHGLTEARGDTIQDALDKMVVCYLCIDMESIDIV